MVYYAQETHLKDRTDEEVMAKFTWPIKMEHIGVGITSFWPIICMGNQQSE